jgi:DNA-binding MarR family transcriptional regulator
VISLLVKEMRETYKYTDQAAKRYVIYVLTESSETLLFSAKNIRPQDVPNTVRALLTSELDLTPDLPENLIGEL